MSTEKIIFDATFKHKKMKTDSRDQLAPEEKIKIYASKEALWNYNMSKVPF